MKTLVSADFFSKGGSIVSIWGSISLAGMFSRMILIVSMEFFASYDLRESISLISSFITWPISGLEDVIILEWNKVILLRVLQASNCLDQSPLLS